MIIRSLAKRLLSAALLLSSFACFAQVLTESSYPMARVLDHALERSSLTGANATPFHIRVRLYESTNPDSGYHAEIEEYWVSPKLWRRTIDSEKFQQTLVVNGDQISEQNAGGYYPLWLRNFIIGIFDPVPNAEQWNKANLKISSITLPDGRKSMPCASMKSTLGTPPVTNDAFSNLCFDASGLLTLVGSPGYAMEFHDYESFGEKLIARRYQDNPEPGTELVAHVLQLEAVTKPDASMFTIVRPTPLEERLEPVQVDQTTIEQAAQGQPPLSWPPVRSGKTAGVLSIYISVDRQGRVREAYPLNADNAELQDAARDQLLKWQLKPILQNGVPVQAEAALTFRFETTLANASH